MRTFFQEIAFAKDRDGLSDGVTEHRARAGHADLGFVQELTADFEIVGEGGLHKGSIAENDEPDAVAFAVGEEFVEDFLGGREAVDLLPLAVFHILGKSFLKAGNYNRAIYYFKKYLTQFGSHISILNALGDCFAQTGQIEEALVALEKSLELEPSQNEIREKIISLKETIDSLMKEFKEMLQN